MIKLLTILISGIFLFFCSYRLQAQTIPWKTRTLVTWQDFQGQPAPGSDFYAFTHTLLAYSFKSDSKRNYTIAVTCAFDKTTSWKKPEKTLTPKILWHEQIHFDISEVFARKMRQSLAVYAAAHKNDQQIAPQMNKIFNDLNKECQDYNNRYDQETNHSMNEEQQQVWTKKVLTQLKDLAAWEEK
jgi:hypothetical protein